MLVGSCRVNGNTSVRTGVSIFRALRKNVSTLEKRGVLESQRCPATPLVSIERRLSKLEQPGNLSHLIYRVSAPLLDDTIGTLLGRAAERWSDHEYLVSVYQNVRLTYGDVLKRADRLAAGLIKLGMKSGDRLGIWAPNDVEWLIAAMSAARAGFILVTINPAYQSAEVEYCLRKVGVKAVISPDSFKTQNYPRMLLNAKEACPTLEHIIIYSKDHTTGTHRFSDVEALASRIEVERIAAEQPLISSNDPFNIQFTSGTTGNPKATLLSHKSIVNNARQAAERGELNNERRVCLNVPFFHAFGLMMGNVASLHSGVTLVLESRSFNPVKALEAMAKEKCDVCFGTPTMWINLLSAHERLRLPIGKLSVGATGGAPASPELFKRIRECFGVEKMKSIYGLTETTAVLFQSLPGEAHELTHNTVGHLSDHSEVMVVDDNGSPVPFGTPGELWSRGYTTMMRYWDDEENTKKTITEDGWLKTGDKFILRSDGYGQIMGRKKDMLIRGGENLFPKEIEDFLMTHPDIIEAQIIGAFDEVYGEEICACLRVKGGKKISRNELADFCKGKIAHFKIPRYVEIVDDYPKTASGKVKKFELKADLERRGVIPTGPK